MVFTEGCRKKKEKKGKKEKKEKKQQEKKRATLTPVKDGKGKGKGKGALPQAGGGAKKDLTPGRKTESKLLKGLAAKAAAADRKEMEQRAKALGVSSKKKNNDQLLRDIEAAEDARAVDQRWRRRFHFGMTKDIADSGAAADSDLLVLDLYVSEIVDIA